MIDRLVVLGAAGDLSSRHLLAGLAHLLAQGTLPAELGIVGVGRDPLTTQAFRDLAAARLAEQAAEVPLPVRAALVARLGYVQADLEQHPDLSAALGGKPVVAYLALPPAVYAPAVRALRAGGMATGSRVVVEKPFGADAASAGELSRLLQTVCDERDVFRVDHFLHHQAVRDLLALRMGNPVLESVWSREHIERVEITWEETAGVTGRAEFYDRTGALKDMVHSHLLQLVALVAMERPERLDEGHLRDAKAAVLRNVPTLTPQQVAARTGRGRYGAGRVAGREQRSYLAEPGVDGSRGTETYAWLQLQVDTERWRGVPFVLRTGKALHRSRRCIALHLRATSPALESPQPTVISLEMRPDRIGLELLGAGSRGLPGLEPVPLEAARPGRTIPASARILRDVLAGDPTFAVRDDEAEECWRIVDAVLAGWRSGTPPLQDYPAGSAVPVPTAGGLPTRGESAE